MNKELKIESLEKQLKRIKSKLQAINKHLELKSLFSEKEIDFVIPRTKSKLNDKEIELSNFEYSLGFQIFSRYDEVMPLLDNAEKELFKNEIIKKQKRILENICRELFDFSDIKTSNYLWSRIEFFTEIFDKSDCENIRMFSVFGVAYEHDYRGFLDSIKMTNTYVNLQEKYLDLREKAVA